MRPSSFSCPGTVHFDVDASMVLPELLRGDYFLFTGSDPDRHAKVVRGIDGKAVGVRPVAGEPSVELAVEAAGAVADSGASTVVAIGGGSVIDAAKAAAALATNPGDAMDYLEVVGEGKPLVEDPLPVVAAPTTFGTGSEVTRNAVLGAKSHRRKVSMRDPRMVPRHAVIDPSLSKSLPRAAAAASAVDALVHICEAFVCNEPCYFMDGFCAEALSRGFAALHDYCDDPGGDAAPSMARASLCGGMMIANARLGAVHGLAGVIGGMTGAAHGNVCAALFAPVFVANVRTLKEAGGGERLERYNAVSMLAMGGPDGLKSPAVIAHHLRKLELPNLQELGVAAADHAQIVAQARGSSSMRGNPVELSDDSLLEVLAIASMDDAGLRRHAGA